jgi:protoheme IX farnesyltransferase
MAETMPSDDDQNTATPSRLADIWSLGKPRLSSLVIFTAGGGMFLAEGDPSKGTILAGLVGTTMVVASANALNNYIERESDIKMARTRDRPLPAGRMQPWVALVYGFLLMAIAIPWMFMETTLLATGLAVFAWFTYVCVYTPLKRRSWLSVLVGGVAGAIPPLIGWTAINDVELKGGIALFAVLFLWQLPHSLAITMYRKSEYAAAGLKILPIEMNDAITRQHIMAYVVGLVAVSLWIAKTPGMGGALTLAGSLALGGVFLWKAWQGLRTEGGAVWARDLFLYSLGYLSGLFVVMALDHVL